MSDALNTAIMKMMDEGFREVRAMLSEQQASASESWRRVYDKLDELQRRVDVVEKSVEASEPTLAEVRLYQQQVKGAGKLGRLLWWAGGGLLTGAVAIYSWRPVIAELLKRGGG
ncbi:hypothetical protein [uncultured Roseibium sp.]|uniref:hypothetical protein n=1 Tax=uncultured Roseibium sp. TaxID=1936171 RepID=UPI002591C622|nr:hypothetical protein [uncultured Roseibium sp.]